MFMSARIGLVAALAVVLAASGCGGGGGGVAATPVGEGPRSEELPTEGILPADGGGPRSEELSAEGRLPAEGEGPRPEELPAESHPPADGEGPRDLLADSSGAGAGYGAFVQTVAQDAFSAVTADPNTVGNQPRDSATPRTPPPGEETSPAPGNGEGPAEEGGAPANGERPKPEGGAPANGERPAEEGGAPANGEGQTEAEGAPANGERQTEEEGAPANGEGQTEEEDAPEDGKGQTAEERLPPGGEAGRSQDLTSWHIFGEGLEDGATYADFLKAIEVRVSEKAATAAGNRPRDAHFLRYHRATGQPALDEYDESGLWHSRSAKGDHNVWLDADSGLVQSSRGTNGRTEDAIAVSLGHNDAGEVTYRLEYRYATSTGGRSGPIRSWSLDSEAEGATFQRWSSGGRKGGVFRSVDPEGSMWVVIGTDVSGPEDTDWLADGMWIHAPSDGAADKFRFGVFADGGDAYSHGRMWALTGTATFTGPASGLFSRTVEGARRNDFFTADATLTADFDGPSFGTVSGRVHGFEVGGEAIAGNPEVTLGSTEIGRVSQSRRYHTRLFDTETRSGGEARMSLGGQDHTGRWSGQFFGNPAADAIGAASHPGSIAGTFGVTAGSGAASRTLIGSFGARRQ